MDEFNKSDIAAYRPTTPSPDANIASLTISMLPKSLEAIIRKVEKKAATEYILTFPPPIWIIKNKKANNNNKDRPA